MLSANPRPLVARVLFLGLAISAVGGADPVYGQAESAPQAANPNSTLTPSVDFPDPFVMREGNVYYALATNAHGHNIQAAVSTDLLTWTQLPDALPRLPSWASRTSRLTWSPSVLKRGEKYILYYTTRDASSAFQCISRAVASQPAGPYEDDSKAPLVCQVSGAETLCGSIDPSPFVDANGVAYLYWKSDENSLSCQTAPRVWVQRLNAAGLQLEGTAVSLLSMDRAWEGHIIEGPAMLLQDGSYFLFYSANWYASANYAVGYATCQTPVGPCKKVTIDEPWLKSAGSSLGPGGQEFFRDVTGQPYIAYHAWSAPNTTYTVGGVRSLRVEPIAVVGGVPRLMR